jgi:hypothetical protein
VTSDPSERFRVPGAEILGVDTWAEDPERCPNCDAEVAAGRAQCPECGQWLMRCGNSCPSCASPRCVGGGRAKGAGR